MLQSLRDNLKGTFAFIIIGIIIVPLALFGVESLFNGTGTGQQAAKINGDEISEVDLRRAIYMQKQQMISRFGENLPADFISDERLREPVLNNLIDSELLRQSAVNQSMAISSQKLDQIILSAPQFQVDGKFDGETFITILRNMGYTPATYKVLLEQDMMNNQLQQGLTASDFTLPSELAANAALSLQVRDFAYVTLSKAAALEGVDASEEEVNAYYEANKSQFVQAEQIAVEYIDLTPDALMLKAEVSDEEIQAQYEQNMEAFEASIERRAAHILLELKEDSSEKAQLIEIQAKLAAGEEFSALAKEYSEDVGSNESGGDLGFSAGDTFPEAFEVALANLEINEISEAVETDAGIHIIKLLEVRGDKAPTLEEQKASIVYGLTRAKAEEQFTELLEILAEESYNAESLADVAESLGLEVVQSDLFGRSGGKGLLANAKVLEAAFSEDVLNEGNSSELIELNEQRVVVVKLINHVESHIKEQGLVAADIEATLKAEKVAQQLSARSAEIVSALNNGDALAEVAANLELSVEEKAAVTRTDATIGSDIVEQAFSLAKPGEKPVVSSFSLNNGDFVVLSLSKVVDGDVSTLSAAEQQSLSTQLAMQSSSVSYQAYRDQLKASADIELR